MRIPEELGDMLQACPEIMQGEVCFAGTYVPVWIVKEYIRNGVSLDEFYLGFPQVTTDMVERFLFWERARNKN